MGINIFDSPERFNPISFTPTWIVKTFALKKKRSPRKKNRKKTAKKGDRSSGKILAVLVGTILGASNLCKKTFFPIPHSPFPIPKKRQILGSLQN